MSPYERQAFIKELTEALNASRKADLDSLKDDIRRELTERFGDHEPRIVVLEGFHGAAKTVGRVTWRVGAAVGGIAGFLKLVGLL